MTTTRSATPMRRDRQRPKGRQHMNAKQARRQARKAGNRQRQQQRARGRR